MKKPVAYAKLHGGDAFIPGIGALSATLPPQNKNLNLKMFYTEFGLLLEFGTGVEAMVPLANIQIVKFAPEEEKPKHAKA